MYKNILQKCIDELNKEPHKIDKVLGMLETLVEMDSIQPTSYPATTVVTPFQIGNSQPVYLSSNVGKTVELSDEEKLAQVYAGGPVGNVGTI